MELDNNIYLSIHELLYKNENSISHLLCNRIMTDNSIITKTNEKLFTFLNKELKTNIITYLERVNIPMFMRTIVPMDNLFFLNNFTISQIPKTKTTHYNNLLHIEHTMQKEGVMKFIWFLNDAEETYYEFMDNVIYKPKRGVLLLFPANWCMPYVIHSNENECINIIEGIVYK